MKWYLLFLYILVKSFSSNPHEGKLLGRIKEPRRWDILQRPSQKVQPMLATGAPQNTSIKEALTKKFDWKLSHKCPACKRVGRVHGGDDQELHGALSSPLGAESFFRIFDLTFCFWRSREVVTQICFSRKNIVF